MKTEKLNLSALSLCFAFFVKMSPSALASPSALFLGSDGYCFPLTADPSSPPICLNTELPIRCQYDAASNESSVQLEDGVWKFALNGKKLVNSNCTEERTADEVHVNCRYGTLFLNVNLGSVSRSQTNTQLELFGTEGGLIFGIPYGQKIPCKATEKF